MKYKIVIVFLISCIAFLASQSFAVLNMEVIGKVRSYDHKTGFYIVYTKEATLVLYNSELTPSMRRTLSRRIGKQVKVTVPHTAVVSYTLRKPSKKNKRKRKPSSVKEDQTETQEKAK